MLRTVKRQDVNRSHTRDMKRVVVCKEKNKDKRANHAMRKSDGTFGRDASVRHSNRFSLYPRREAEETLGAAQGAKRRNFFFTAILSTLGAGTRREAQKNFFYCYSLNLRRWHKARSAEKIFLLLFFEL